MSAGVNKRFLTTVFLQDIQKMTSVGRIVETKIKTLLKRRYMKNTMYWSKQKTHPFQGNKKEMRNRAKHLQSKVR